MKKIIYTFAVLAILYGCNGIDPKKEALKSMTEFVKANLEKSEKLDEIRLISIDTVTELDKSLFDVDYYLSIANKNIRLYELEKELYQLHQEMLTPNSNSYDIIMHGHEEDMENYKSISETSTESAKSIMENIHKKDSVLLDSYHVVFYIAISENNLQSSDSVSVLMTKDFKIIKNKK